MSKGLHPQYHLPPSLISISAQKDRAEYPHIRTLILLISLDIVIRRGEGGEKDNG